MTLLIGVKFIESGRMVRLDLTPSFQVLHFLLYLMRYENEAEVLGPSLKSLPDHTTSSLASIGCWID